MSGVAGTSHEVRVSSAPYEGEDDCLSAAAAEWAAEHDCEGYDLLPRWETDDDRSTIVLTVPDWADVGFPGVSGTCDDCETPCATHTRGASGQPICPTTKTTEYVLTDPQRAVLAYLYKRNGSEHLRGAKVRVAHKLAALGLVTVEDNGGYVKGHDEFNAERWMVALTAAGTGVAANLAAAS